MSERKVAEKGSFREFYEILSYLAPKLRSYVLERTAISIVYETLKLVPVYLVKIIIDDVFTQPSFHKDGLLVLGIFVVFLILAAVDLGTFVGANTKLADMQKQLLERIHRKLLKLPISYHEKQRTGSVITKINKAGHYLAEILWFTHLEIVPIILQLILTSGLLIYTDWKIGLLYIGALFPLLWLISDTRRKTQPYREKYQQSYDLATGELAQSLYNVKTVKDYAQEHKEHCTYSEMLGQYVNTYHKRLKFELPRLVLRDALMTLIRAGAMLYAVWLVIQHQLTPGDLVLVFTLTEKAFLNLYRLGRIYDLLGDSHEALSLVRKILLEPNTLLEQEKPASAPENLGKIEFKNVDFSYGTESVLKKVNFAIPSKKVIAVIGASGSGKSTIINLLTRHYDPSSGAVLLDDIDLRELSLQALRKRIAVVSQHTEIFNRTIHDNIAYARPEATRKEVVAAAKKANADKFIRGFTEGYDTMVGEKGIRLSGGQQQRISIARALLADPEVLVFDEATSSLDSESEISIQKAIFSARGKYTMVLIAHRLSTIEKADVVVVLEKGRIAEIGSQKELLRKKKGFYRKMRELQHLGQLRR